MLELTGTRTLIPRSSSPKPVAVLINKTCEVTTGQFCSLKEAGAVPVNVWRIPFSVETIVSISFRGSHLSVTRLVRFKRPSQWDRS
jgi:hypothetical protein